MKYRFLAITISLVLLATTFAACGAEDTSPPTGEEQAGQAGEANADDNTITVFWGEITPFTLAFPSSDPMELRSFTLELPETWRVDQRDQTVADIYDGSNIISTVRLYRHEASGNGGFAHQNELHSSSDLAEEPVLLDRYPVKCYGLLTGEGSRQRMQYDYYIDLGGGDYVWFTFRPFDSEDDVRAHFNAVVASFVPTQAGAGMELVDISLPMPGEEESGDLLAISLALPQGWTTQPGTICDIYDENGAWVMAAHRSRKAADAGQPFADIDLLYSNLSSYAEELRLSGYSAKYYILEAPVEDSGETTKQFMYYILVEDDYVVLFTTAGSGTMDKDIFAAIGASFATEAVA